MTKLVGLIVILAFIVNTNCVLGVDVSQLFSV